MCLAASDVASLDGSSSLVYSPSPSLKRTYRDVIALKFKTVRNSGILLHAGGADGRGLSVELEKGKLLLLLTQGRRGGLAGAASHLLGVSKQQD